jgi:uncharacterized OsmC-like protein
MRVDITRKDDQHLVVAARDVTVSIDRYATEDEPSDGFRATELLLGSLGACMLGTAIGFARNQEMPLEDLTVSLEAESAKHPERLASIKVTMTVTGSLTEPQLNSLRRVATRCKVHNTLDDPPHLALEMVQIG